MAAKCEGSAYYAQDVGSVELDASKLAVTHNLALYVLGPGLVVAFLIQAKPSLTLRGVSLNEEQGD